MSHSGKLVTVFGSTGFQGGSVVEAALQAGWKVRGVSRNTQAAKAQALAKKGVELVQTDITTASVADLAKILQGSYAAFLMTAFWDPASMGKEEELGRKLVDASKAAGVKQVLWSALDDCDKISGNKIHVPHFTGKAHVTAYIEELQKSSKTFQFVTYVAPAFYYQNFRLFGMATLEGDTWNFVFPNAKRLTACDVTQTGLAVAKALQEPERFNGKRIEYWGEHAHPQSYVDTFTRVTGKKAKLTQVDPKVYKTFYKGAEEIAEMVQWFNEYSYYGPNGQPFAEWSGQRNTPGGLHTFEEFLRNGGWDK